MKRFIQGCLTYFSLVLAIGWWDVWYPELTKAAGVYEVVCEETTVQTPEEMLECGLGEDAYRNWMKADGEQIRFRFRFLEWMEEYWNKG